MGTEHNSQTNLAPVAILDFPRIWVLVFLVALEDNPDIRSGITSGSRIGSLVSVVSKSKHHSRGTNMTYLMVCISHDLQCIKLICCIVQPLRIRIVEV
jgi:hypothetical protein